ncbi:MAG: hypothetical protein JJE49_07330 [Peptostreptococcaceae bacterium]|nr:hypothetical protein [Peptostreptococcaceae bacterium]
MRGPDDTLCLEIWDNYFNMYVAVSDIKCNKHNRPVFQRQKIWRVFMINLPQNDKFDVRILEKVLSDQYITLSYKLF